SDHVSAERADDWDLMRRLLGSDCGRREPGHDHVDFELHQFRCQFGKMVHLSLVRSEFEPNVFPLDITELAQRLAKQLPELLPTGSGTHQNANGCHLRLLRPRRERPCRSAAQEGDELAPLHSITSSASASSLSGIWRPSALAVLRLMVNSSF